MEARDPQFSSLLLLLHHSLHSSWKKKKVKEKTRANNPVDGTVPREDGSRPGEVSIGLSEEPLSLGKSVISLIVEEN